MKRLVALIASVAFVAGMTGSVLAQAPQTPQKQDKAKKPAAQIANGTVKTSAADGLVVSGKAKDGKDTEWTFAVDPRTKIRKGGKDITAADLVAGDAVHVRYHAEAGKNVADEVMVRAPKKAAEAPKAPAPKKDETKK